MANEPEELAPELRALFDDYPLPTGDAAFDARFWRELDARKNRYRGLSGILRRLVEIEIEGIAVWRLGLSLFGGAAVCGLGVAILSLSAPTQSQPAPQIALEQIPSAMPRYARGWDERVLWPEKPAPVAPKSAVPQEVSSCASSANGWA